MQVDGQRFFLHEHPHTASSWKMTEVVAMINMKNVETTTCDMCAYGLKSADADGEASVQKRTRLMSNCHGIIKRVSAQCTNKTAEKESDKHRHGQLLGGNAKACQVYPRMFTRAVCEGIAAQKVLLNLGLRSQPLMAVGEMTTVVKTAGMAGTDTAVSNPSKELHEDDGIIAYDDQSGATLSPAMVAAARQEEIRYFHEMKVYRKVNISECWNATGKPPIAVRWIDINKGDSDNPNYRSRLVAK